MATKTAKINARVESALKEETEHILDKLGLSTTEAIRLYFKQIVQHRGIPFDIRIPNPETRAAMEDARAERDLTERPSSKDHFKSAAI